MHIRMYVPFLCRICVQAYVHVCVGMGCELISFPLIVRNDGKRINHEGLRQLQTSHMKAHPLAIHTITGTVAWASTISHVCFVPFCTIVLTCMCVVSIQV